MKIRTISRPIFVLLLVFQGSLNSLTSVPPAETTGQGSARTVLAFEDLMQSGVNPEMPVANDYFLPVGETAPALHALEGRLTVPRGQLQRDTILYQSERVFPGFSVDFFTQDGYLVPAERGLILSDSSWSLMLSPGRVWSEAGDNGMSRASFPFILGSPAQRRITGGEVHNGVATFLFDDTGVSEMFIQITQETAADGNIYDMWGQYSLEYEPGPVENRDALAADFAAELEDQMPIRPWSELETLYDPEALGTMTAGLDPETISAAGLVLDEVIYLQPSLTRHGQYPYPREMQHAAMSISKTIGAGIGMLWLAEEYGPEVFDLKVIDYLSVNAEHDGWQEVTFGNLLDMAAGVGENSPTLRPFDVFANDSGPNYIAWYLAETTAEKLRITFLAGDYPWGPGELFRYTGAHTFVLAAAMDSFLKSKEGPDAHLWERMMEEVFRPIGIHHLDMMHVADSNDGPGVPLFASGLRYTVEDVGKIVTLLQNGGRHNGVQILHAEKLQEALLRTGEVLGLPSGNSFTYGDQGYHMSFWSIVHRTRDGRYFQIPFMSGAGGNTILLLPNGVSNFVFTDSNYDGYSINGPTVAEAIRPFPGDGVRLGWMLLGRGVWLIPEVQQKVQIANTILYVWLATALASAGFIFWHTGRRSEFGRFARVLWSVAAVVFGVLSLLAYALFGRRKETI